MSTPAAAPAESSAPETPNDTTSGFTLWAVLRRDPARPDDLDGTDVPKAVQELDGVIAELRAFGDGYPTRRRREAAYLEAALRSV